MIMKLSGRLVKIRKEMKILLIMLIRLRKPEIKKYICYKY